jgi:hypothetical protein
LGNSVAIKSGDNLSNENLVGIYNSESFDLCMEGLEGKAIFDGNSFCITVKRIE